MVASISLAARFRENESRIPQKTSDGKPAET